MKIPSLAKQIEQGMKRQQRLEDQNKKRIFKAREKATQGPVLKIIEAMRSGSILMFDRSDHKWYLRSEPNPEAAAIKTISLRSAQILQDADLVERSNPVFDENG